MPIFAVCVLRFGLYLYYPPLMVEKVKNARSLSQLLIKMGGSVIGLSMFRRLVVVVF